MPNVQIMYLHLIHCFTAYRTDARVAVPASRDLLVRS